jgi:alkylated DNA repair dioxygenase AlkB
VVKLESGDVIVFGGPARMVFHAVPKIYPGTAPEQLLKATGLRPGRINLTFRQL